MPLSRARFRGRETRGGGRRRIVHVSMLGSRMPLPTQASAANPATDGKLVE